MRAPQAQSKLSEVLEFLQQYEGTINPNKLIFGRWIKDAQALRLVDPSEGYMMEAWVYRAQGKLDKALEYMKNAYRLDSSSNSVNVNYASLLLSSGDFNESEKLCIKRIRLDRTNTDIFKILITNTLHTFNQDVLFEAIELFIPTNPEAEKVIGQAKKRIFDFDHMQSTLESANLSIEVYKRFSSITQKVRNTRYIGESRTVINCEVNELGTFLLIDEALANASIEDCLSMYDDLVEEIINDDHYFEEYKKIIFNFIPTTSTAINSAYQLEV